MATKTKAKKKTGDSCATDSEKLLDKLTKELYIAKQRKKQADAECKKLEKAVKQLMEEQGLEEHGVIATIDKNKVGIQAKYPQTFKNVVNIEKLAEIAKTKKVFFSMISATQTAVKEVLGENALARVIEEVPGPRTLTIKAD